MAWKCIVEGKELADVRADRKESESIEIRSAAAAAACRYSRSGWITARKSR